MSESPDRESKTEDATPRKLEQARAEGQGPKTMDLGAAATLTTASAVILGMGGWLSHNMMEKLTPFFSRPETMTLQGGGAVEVFRYALMAAAPAILIVMLSAGGAGAAANLLQGGIRFTPKKLAPDFSKLDPRQGFARIFGPDGLMQFVKSIAKITVTTAIAWWSLKPVASQLPSLATMDISTMMPFSLDVLKRLVFGVAILTLVIAGADWLWQRQRFLEKMKMTKEEVKEDFKNTEGDPHVKARQKQLRNERARRRMMQAVPGATVVVMNPTHYAVALKYDQSETPAPMCVAKGLDSLALKIRSVAEEAGVPVIEDPPLARALYAAVDIDDMIPPAHYEAVAKIIGFILGAARQRRPTPAARPML